MILPPSKVERYSSGAFIRSVYHATMFSVLGMSSCFLIVYGFFSMIAILVDSDAGREFAAAAGLFVGGFGALSGLGIATKAVGHLDEIAKEERR